MKRDEASITLPCGADWSSMQPRGTARLCGACDRLVHDLSAMGEAQARAVLHAPRNERLCIRYLHDTEGNIWFGGEPTAPVMPANRLVRKRAPLVALAAAAAVVAAPMLLEACGGAGPYDPTSGVAADPSPDGRAADPGVNAGDGGDAGEDARVDGAADAGSDGGAADGSEGDSSPAGDAQTTD